MGACGQSKKLRDHTSNHKDEAETVNWNWDKTPNSQTVPPVAY